jgi:hypothetical protein
LPIKERLKCNLKFFKFQSKQQNYLKVNRLNVKRKKMDIAAEVSEILSEAERKLTELAMNALQRRDYVTVQWLSTIAERIATTIVGSHSECETSRGSIIQMAVTPNSTKREEDSKRQSIGTLPSSTSNSMAGPFPHFFRDSEQLIKIGYSKSEKRTYEHRSPNDVLHRLADLIVKSYPSGQLFTTYDVLKQFELETPTLPTYQLYLCLGFLVRSGLVRKNGRSGYTIDFKYQANFAASVITAWEFLPKR